MSSDEEISIDGEPEEPKALLKFLDCIRAEWTSNVRLLGEKKGASNDTAQNIILIRALFKTNQEIFERCMTNATSFGEKTQVSRYGFDRITTRLAEGSRLELVTQPERTVETFDTLPLARLPDGLEGTLVVKYKKAPHQKFINYEGLFRKALTLLHHDVLEVFLERLKDQLELIQVALGEIDLWTMQPSNNVAFIEETFGKQLDLPTDIDPFTKTGECCYCKERTRDYSTSVYCHVNKCNQVHILSDSTVPGRHETTFDLETESERASLKRFLDFING